MSDLCDKLRESALRSVCGNTDLADKTLYAIAADCIRELEAEVERLQFLAGKYFDEKIEARKKLAAIDGLPKHETIESSWGVPDINGPWINAADIDAILRGKMEG